MNHSPLPDRLKAARHQIVLADSAIGMANAIRHLEWLAEAKSYLVEARQYLTAEIAERDTRNAELVEALQSVLEIINGEFDIYDDERISPDALKGIEDAHALLAKEAAND